MKYLNFSITEESGRTFELPMEKAVEIVNQIKENDKYVKDVKVDFTDEYEVAEFFVHNGYLSEVANYETSNEHVETVLADSRIYEGKK